ncbi:MAG: hypothetical protein KGN01_05880 [Patescibacteria group bacterium]|nr:hypothetical protein [Patescibacteria group bacterium]
MTRRTILGMFIALFGFVRPLKANNKENNTNERKTNARNTNERLDWMSNFVRYVKSNNLGRIVYITAEGDEVRGPKIKSKEVRETDVCICTCQETYDRDSVIESMILLDKFGNKIYQEYLEGSFKLRANVKTSFQFSFPIPSIQSIEMPRLGVPTPTDN